MGTKRLRAICRARLDTLWANRSGKPPRTTRSSNTHSARVEETRQECRQLLATLGLGDRFDLDTLRRAVEAYIGRSIVIRPEGQPDRPNARGAVHREGDCAIVEYDPLCPPDQRRMTIYHEFGHLIWKHQRALARQLLGAGVLNRMVACDRTALLDHVGLEVRGGTIHVRGQGERQYRGDGPLDPEELQAEVMGDEIYRRMLPDDPDPIARWLEL